MAGRAPNFSVTGFQLSEVRKPRPKARHAGKEPCRSASMTPASSTSTVIAEISVSDLNAMSPRRKRRSVAARSSSAWTEAISFTTTAASIISKTFHSVAVATCRKDEDRNGQRPPYPLAYPSLVHGEDRLAGRVLNVSGPHLLNVVDDLVRYRDVVELLGHLVAVLVRPGEEERRQDGRGAQLHPDTGQGRRRRSEDVVQRH